MKLITQPESDLLFERALNDPNLYAYLAIGKRITPWKVYEDDWMGLMLTNDQNTFIADITFDRSSDLEFSIALYAFNPFAAGKGILAIQEVIKRYRPTTINSRVHASNVKSLKLHQQFYGEPWGREPAGGWNMLTGEFEDLLYFKKKL